VNAPTVLGIDPSLSSTGLARVRAHLNPADPADDWTDAVRVGDDTGHPRMLTIVRAVLESSRGVDLVVIEGPAHSKANQAGHHELAGLWWQITQALWESEVPYAVCTPDGRTVYATGRARHRHAAGAWMTSAQVKGLVRSTVAERYGIPLDGKGRNDRADALILAHAGLEWLGYPRVKLPNSHRRALYGVAWPSPAPACRRVLRSHERAAHYASLPAQVLPADTLPLGEAS
jgi:Holliday junction resolvasome RuvABC endonuclease subunit